MRASSTSRAASAARASSNNLASSASRTCSASRASSARRASSLAFSSAIRASSTSRAAASRASSTSRASSAMRASSLVFSAATTASAAILASSASLMFSSGLSVFLLSSCFVSRFPRNIPFHNPDRPFFSFTLTSPSDSATATSTLFNRLSRAASASILFEVLPTELKVPIVADCFVTLVSSTVGFGLISTAVDPGSRTSSAVGWSASSPVLIAGDESVFIGVGSVFDSGDTTTFSTSVTDDDLAGLVF